MTSMHMVGKAEELLAAAGWDTLPRINGSHRIYTDAYGVTVGFTPPHGPHPTEWEGVFKDLRKRIDMGLKWRRDIIEREEKKAAHSAALNGNGNGGAMEKQHNGPALWHCKNCNRDKPVTAFQRAPHVPSGHLSVCTECMTELRKAGYARKGSTMGAHLPKGHKPAPVTEQSAADMMQRVAKVATTIAGSMQRDIQAIMAKPEPVPVEAVCGSCGWRGNAPLLDGQVASDCPACGAVSLRAPAVPAPVVEPEPAPLEVVGQLDLVTLPDVVAILDAERPQLWVAGDYAVLWDGERAHVLTTRGEGPREGLTPDLAAYILRLLGAPREGKHYY